MLNNSRAATRPWSGFLLRTTQDQGRVATRLLCAENNKRAVYTLYATRFRPPLRPLEVLNRPGQGHVLFRDLVAGVVRAQRYDHGAVDVVDFRMVVLLLGVESEAHDEAERFLERVELEGAGELLVLALPAGQVLQGALDGLVIEGLAHHGDSQYQSRVKGLTTLRA